MYLLRARAAVLEEEDRVLALLVEVWGSAFEDVQSEAIYIDGLVL